MWIEYTAYVVTFVVSAGLSAIGIMLSYQLYETHQKPHLQILLYQQIFLISFFLFAIWGNMILHKIISDLQLNPFRFIRAYRFSYCVTYSVRENSTNSKSRPFYRTNIGNYKPGCTFNFYCSVSA